MTSRLPELLSLMRRLRAQDGCPWDRQQTFASIAPYTVEEAYEVADAIDRGDLAHLRDELGDLLFQVVFLSQMASEQGDFDFEAVVGSICDKLVRRHPHVFGQGGRLTADEQAAVWEDIKARERGGDSALHGVPQSLPALMRAYKLSKRAARVGFDFDHPQETADKVAEELAEVREAAAASEAAAVREAAGEATSEAAGGSHAGAPSQETFEEVGDLLFAAANLARKLGVDAESALRAANLKFERRFRAMEQLARARGQVFSGLNLAAQESLWLDVKRAE
jgi:nucleoside triphosphate diphosphatase